MEEKNNLNLKNSLYELFFENNVEGHITFKSKTIYEIFKNYLQETKYHDLISGKSQSLASYIKAQFDDKTNSVCWSQPESLSKELIYIILGKFFAKTNQDWPEDYYTHYIILNKETKRPYIKNQEFLEEDTPNLLYIGAKSGRAPYLIPPETLKLMKTWTSYITAQDTVESFIERLAFIDQLDAYIKRIELHKLENNPNQIDYAHGFWFFPESRAINRQKNYELAKQLCNQLKSGSNITDVFSNIEGSQRIRSTGSTELNAIIETAQKYIKVSQQILKPS